MSIEATSNCAYHKGILFRPGKWGDRHFDYNDVARNAAHTGCEICTILSEAVRRIEAIASREGSDDPDSGHMPQSKQWVTLSGTLPSHRNLESGVEEFEFYYLNGNGLSLYRCAWYLRRNASCSDFCS